MLSGPRSTSPAPRDRRRDALAWLTVCATGSLLPACDRASVSGMAGGFKGLDVSGVSYGRGFALTDHHGQARTLEDFRGQVVLLYFGFVQCPDVCPTALTRAAAVKDKLGEQAARLQVLFVTVDPERDTPEMLRAYMAAFDPTFLALSGGMADIKKAADEFRVYYKKVPTGSSYTMDHTALSYLIDPAGRLRVALRHEQTADDYAADIRTLLAESAT